MAPSLELGGIGGVEQGGSVGPPSLMLVLGMLLGFQGIPLSTAMVGCSRKRKQNNTQVFLEQKRGWGLQLQPHTPALRPTPEVPTQSPLAAFHQTESEGTPLPVSS